MLGRFILFVLWGALGALISYALLYALTPYGVGLLAFAAVAGLLMPRAGGERWPEALGLLVGPGVLCLLVAANGGASEPAAWGAVGASIILCILTAYLLVGRARCARSA